MTIKKYVRILHRIKDPKCPEREIKAYTKDWYQRSKIFLRWLKNIPKEAKILDCGCGIGIAGLILKENGFKNIVGIDINKENIKIASNFFKCYLMNCENIKLKEKFDVILALNIIEHLKNPRKFLNRVKRILTCEDLFILSLPNEIWFRKLLSLVPRDLTHKQSWNIFSFKKFLNDNGFEVLDMEPVGRIPFLLGCQTFMVLARRKR